MKKKDIILLALVLIVILGGLFFTIGNKNKSANYTLMELSDKEIGINNIDYTYFDSLIKQDGVFIVYIGRDSCSWCQKYRPELQEASGEKNIKVLYINTDSLSENEYNGLVSASDGHFTGGTPTTLLMKGSKVIDEIGGYTTKKEILKFFKKYGLVD